MFFFQRNSSPLFLITRSSSFSVFHASVDTKNNFEKDSTLLLFFLSKSPGGHAMPKTPRVTCGVIPVNWVISHWYACGANGRTIGWTLFGWMNYHIFLGMGFRSRALWSSAISLLIIQTSIGNSMICSDIWHKYHERYFKIVMRNSTKR